MSVEALYDRLDRAARADTHALASWLARAGTVRDVIQRAVQRATPKPTGPVRPKGMTWLQYFRQTLRPERPSDALADVAQRVIDAYEDDDFARSLEIRHAAALLLGMTPEQILDAPEDEREALLEAVDVDGGFSEQDLNWYYVRPHEQIGLTPAEALELGGFPPGTRAKDITPEILDDLTDRITEIAGKVIDYHRDLAPTLREMGGGKAESLADVRYEAEDLQSRIVPIEKDAAFALVRRLHSKLPDPRPMGLLVTVGVAAGGALRVVGLLNTPSGKFGDPAGVVELARVASDGTLKGGSSAITLWAMRNLQRFNRSGDPAQARFVTTSLLTEPGEVYAALEPFGLRPTSLVTPSKAAGLRKGAIDTARKGEWKINWEYGPAAPPEQPHLYKLHPVYRDVVMDRQKLTIKRLNSLVQRPGTDPVRAYADAARVLGVPASDPAMRARRGYANTTPERRQEIADGLRYMLLATFNSPAVAEADQREQRKLRAAR